MRFPPTREWRIFIFNFCLSVGILDSRLRGNDGVEGRIWRRRFGDGGAAGRVGNYGGGEKFLIYTPLRFSAEGGGNLPGKLPGGGVVRRCFSVW
ncbi:MAG: hypothetical protein HAW59_01860 [Betaproteobacteria bacterium]|nr:hypothetical protein [Betaproteobacteria bacterium]